jgi:hypothetical protein
VGGNTVDFARPDGSAWYSARGGAYVTNWATTDSNEVPPTDNTGTIVAAIDVRIYQPLVVRLEEYGQLVRDQSSFIYSLVSTVLYEIVPDAVLEKMLTDMETQNGWPWFGMPIRPGEGHG